MPTVAELGARVKAKYPGSYDDLADDDLGRRIKAKYPGSYDDFAEVEAASQQPPARPFVGEPLIQAEEQPPAPVRRGPAMIETSRVHRLGEEAEIVERPARRGTGLENVLVGPFELQRAGIEGFTSGLVQSTAGALGGALQIAGIKFDSEGISEAGEAIAKKAGETVEQIGAGTEDPLDNPGVLLDPTWWAKVGGSAAGSLLPAMIPGIAAARGADRIAKFVRASERVGQAIRTAGGASAAGVTEGLMNGSLAFLEAKEQGAGDEEAAELAARVASRTGAVAVAGFGAGIFNEAIKGQIKRALVSSLVEGAEEATAEVIQNVELGRPAEQGVLTAGIGGALVGGPAGALMAPTEVSPVVEPAAEPRRRGGTGIGFGRDRAAAISEPASIPVAKEEVAAEVVAPVAEEVQTDDRQAREGLPSEVEERQEPIEAGPVEVRGEEEAAPSGALQAEEGVAGEPEPESTVSETVEVQAEAEAPAVETAPARAPSVEPARGRSRRVSIPGESERSYQARYEIREADDVVPSHDPVGFQADPRYQHKNTRDYSKPQNQARVIEHSQKFNPDLLLSDAPTAETGTPIVDASGNVLGGNNRAMTLGRIRQLFPQHWRAYQEELPARVAQFGIGPGELVRFKNPVLVREVDDVPDVQLAIEDLNKKSTAEHTPFERAVTEGNRLSDRTVEVIVDKLESQGEDGSLADVLRGRGGAEILNQLIKDGVITVEERAGMVEEREGGDELTPEAKRRIAQALIGRLFEDSTQYENSPPALRSKLERIAPHALRSEGREGWGLKSAIREALVLLEDFYAHRGVRTIDNLIRQETIGEKREYSPQAVALAKVLEEQGPLAAARAFRAYANMEAESREGAQASFFEPPSQEEAFREAFGPLPEIRQKTRELFSTRPREGERGSLSLRPTPEVPGYQGPPLRTASALRGAVDFFKPVRDVIADEGNAGQRISAAIDEASDWGEVEAGKRLEKLRESGLSRLSKAERVEVVDVLEGRSKGSERVRAVAGKIREVLNETADVAEQLGVEIETKEGRKPFQRIRHYYPHVIRSIEQLSKRGRVREDVIKNLVRLDEAPDMASAAQMLDDYIAFVDGKDPAKSLVAYLVATGQAKNHFDALAKLKHYRQKVRRHGSVEFAREINLPFWDPDPGMTLPHWIASASERLEQIRVFGQNNEEIARLLEQLEEEGGNVTKVQRLIQRVMGVVEDDPNLVKISRLVRMIQGFKLGLASIPNASQGALNTLFFADLPSTVAGFRGLITRTGHKLGRESGATIDSVLNEMTREAGGDSGPLGLFLKATGFTLTERLNRVYAASAGVKWANRLLKRLKTNLRDVRTRERLAELGLDPDDLVRRGYQLYPDEVLLVAKKFSDLTQFRSRVQDMPAMASHPVGKVFWQFKTFIYNQGRLITRKFKRELSGLAAAVREGDTKLATERGLRVTRDLLVLGTVFPLTGEMIKAVRAAIQGRDREEKGIERYFDDMLQVGSLGILGAILEAGQFGRTAGFLLGPAGSDIAELVDALARAKEKDEAAVKYLARRIPFFGQLLYHRWFGRKPARGERSEGGTRERREPRDR